MLKNDPGCKFHDFWPQFSTLKNIPESIFNDPRYSSLHRLDKGKEIQYTTTKPDSDF